MPANTVLIMGCGGTLFTGGSGIGEAGSYSSVNVLKFPDCEIAQVD